MDSFLTKNLKLLGVEELYSEDYFYKKSGQKFSLKTIVSDKPEQSGCALFIFPGLDLSDLNIQQNYYKSIFLFTKTIQELFHYLSLIDLSVIKEIKNSYISCTDFTSSREDLKLQFEKLHFKFSPSTDGIKNFEILFPEGLEEKELLNSFEFWFLNILIEERARELPENLFQIRHRVFGENQQCEEVKKLENKPVILFPSTLWIASGQFLRTLLKIDDYNVIFFRNAENKRKLFNETDLLLLLEQLKPDALFMLNLNALVNSNIYYFRVIDFINKNKIKVLSFNFDNMISNAKNLSALMDPGLIYLFDIRQNDMELFKKSGYNCWPHFYCTTDLMLSNGFKINSKPPKTINFIANVDTLESLNKRIEKFKKAASYRDLQIINEVFNYIKDLNFNFQATSFLNQLNIDSDKKNELLYICGEFQRVLLVQELIKKGVPIKIFGIASNWLSHGIFSPTYNRELSLVPDFYPVYRDCIFCLDQLRLWNLGAFNDRVLPIVMAGGLAVLASYSKEWKAFTEEETDYYDTVDELVELYNFYSKSETGLKKREEKICAAYQKALSFTPEKHFSFMFEKAGLL